MFEMKVEKQMSVRDRTLIVGVPQYDTIPKKVNTGNRTFNVIGVSQGVKIPFMSLEIEKTTFNLEGKTVRA